MLLETLNHCHSDSGIKYDIIDAGVDNMNLINRLNYSYKYVCDNSKNVEVIYCHKPLIVVK